MGQQKYRWFKQAAILLQYLEFPIRLAHTWRFWKSTFQKRHLKNLPFTGHHFSETNNNWSCFRNLRIPSTYQGLINSFFILPLMIPGFSDIKIFISDYMMDKYILYRKFSVSDSPKNHPDFPNMGTKRGNQKHFRPIYSNFCRESSKLNRLPAFMFPILWILKTLVADCFITHIYVLRSPMRPRQTITIALFAIWLVQIRHIEFSTSNNIS